MHKPVTNPADFPTEFERALNAGDLGRIIALYDDHATMRTPDNQVQSGLPAVREEMSQLIGAKARIANQLRHTLVHDNTALIIVDWTLNFLTPDGRETHQQDTATNVLQLDSSHGWKMIVANPYGVA